MCGACMAVQVSSCAVAKRYVCARAHVAVEEGYLHKMLGANVTISSWSSTLGQNGVGMVLRHHVRRRAETPHPCPPCASPSKLGAPLYGVLLDADAQPVVCAGTASITKSIHPQADSACGRGLAAAD